MSKTSSCEYDIFSIGKYSSDRFEGLTPHNDRMAKCCFLKMPEIFRDMPRNFPIISDNTIACHGSDSNILYFLFFMLTDIFFHHFPISLYLDFQLFQSKKFLILTNLKEWSYRNEFSVDIGIKVEKMRLKKLNIFQIYSYTIV